VALERREAPRNWPIRRKWIEILPFREDRGRPRLPATAQLLGFRPRKLGHVNLLTGRIGSRRVLLPVLG
jgi:hypothetical protein